MGEQVFGISLGARSVDASDYIFIEQEPWAKDVGRTSKSQGILAMGSMIFGGKIPLPNCGGLAGFNTPVYVYPSRSDLQFIFRVSHGDFQPATVTTMIREEIIKCGLKDKATCEYPVSSMLSKRWLGPCRDAKGNTVPRPTVIQQGRDFHFSSKVLSSMRIRYTVYRRTYLVRIEERQDSIENNFQCVAFCVFAGGGKWQEIEAPSGYEATLGNCGNGIYDSLGASGSGSSEICQPDWGKGSYPKAVRADKLTRQDYCSQQILSERITESEESANEPGEECSDGPLVTN